MRPRWRRGVPPRDYVQFCTSLRRENANSVTLDYSEANTVALTARLPSRLFCNFTGWCAPRHRHRAASSAFMPGAADGAPEAAVLGRQPAAIAGSPETPTRQGRPKTFAVVIKGPLLAFTHTVITFYGEHMDSSSTAIIFSHNNGSCYSQARAKGLASLAARFPNFASTIQPTPPRLGHNFRNAQREACYYGALFAVRTFQAEFIFMHRHDTVFQTMSILADLVDLLKTQPPATVDIPGGRVGLCPFQTQFTDAYGKFSLDDHCMFGRSEAVLHFWSTSNVLYNSSADSWSKTKDNPRRYCSAPGVESDNGYSWVMDDYIRRQIAPPPNTKSLIEQRAFVLNPEAWGHVCLRGRGNLRVSLPCNTSLNRMSFRRIAPAAPFGVFRQCRRLERLYDCSTVGEVQGRVDTPRWACFATHTSCREKMAAL
eukprot:1231014-Prymnesium_polylepis.1